MSRRETGRTAALLLLLVLLWGIPDATRAQDDTRTGIAWTTGEEQVHEFSIWGGHAFDSWNNIWGKTADATLSLVGARYQNRFLRINRHLLKYTAEFRLYAAYTYPAVEPSPEPTSTLRGFGISPLGFQFNFYGDGKIQPFLRTSTGLMYLNGPFPDERGTRTNFTFGLGGGMEFILTEHTSLSLGYSFLHLSNGEIGLVNPGIDSSLFYLSLTFF